MFTVHLFIIGMIVLGGENIEKVKFGNDHKK